jgi:hypothetical protein
MSTPPPTTSTKNPLEETPSPNHNDRAEGGPALDSVIKKEEVKASQDETAWIHIRAVISGPEAAIIIGRGGENISKIRQMSGAKCIVSDYQRDIVERILTVSGVVDAVAKVKLTSPL